MKTLIKGATLVNEGVRLKNDIVMENGVIAAFPSQENSSREHYDETVDATGCFVLPGVIDEHVHFREPGFTAKADIESESRAAAYGGVTTFFDMPNTMPQTTTPEALDDKRRRGREESHINYSFFYGATNTNADTFDQIDRHHTPGIKLFMGSSTGNMLVDRDQALQRIFSVKDLPVMTHCEDTAIINRNMKAAKAAYGEDPAIEHFPEIRSVEACYASTRHAVELARKQGARLHVAHLTTAKELELFEPNSDEQMKQGRLQPITAEAVVAHLLFTADDYATLGSRIKCNPCIKSKENREALRRALTNGCIATIATDHAPHLPADKEGGCCKAASGMPMVQFSLPAMLDLVDEGVLSIERLVQLMCHNPANLFEIHQRGFLRQGYKADIVVVKPHANWTLTSQEIQSKCGWSPLTGHTFGWRVVHTFCNGRHIYNNGIFDPTSKGEEIDFR